MLECARKVKENRKYLSNTLISRVRVRGAVREEGVSLVTCFMKKRPRATMSMIISGIRDWKKFRRKQL